MTYDILNVLATSFSLIRSVCTSYGPPTAPDSSSAPVSSEAGAPELPLVRRVHHCAAEHQLVARRGPQDPGTAVSGMRRMEVLDVGPVGDAITSCGTAVPSRGTRFCRRYIELAGNLFCSFGWRGTCVQVSIGGQLGSPV